MFDLASVLMADLADDERARMTEILHDEYAHVVPDDDADAPSRQE